jgi:hypothetical protein
MRNRRTFTLVAGALAAMATAVGCRDTAMPTSPEPRKPSLWETEPPPNEANFRLTGGGRVDKEDHEDPSKNPPGSHDFATFGFQARPGSGNITWVEHNPDAPGGGFTFHGRVTEFTPIAGDGDCATFSGTGRGRTRDGTSFDEIEFVVLHACDVREPGRGADHIEIVIDALGYTRHGPLSGGNIQSHAL